MSEHIMKLFRSFAVSLLMVAGVVGIVAYAITQISDESPRL
jgi:hypothetical protein